MSFYRYLFGVFIILSAKFSYAQSAIQRIDSLITLAQQVINIDSSNRIIDQVIKESVQYKYKMGLADGVLIKCANMQSSDRHGEALKLIQKWENFMLETEDNTKSSQFYALKANSYVHLYFFEEARRCLKQAKIYADKIIDDNTRYACLAKVFVIFSSIFENTKGKEMELDSILHYSKKAYFTQEKIIGGGLLRAGLITQGTTIAHTYLKARMEDSAFHYFNRSIWIAQKEHLQKHTFSTYIGLGDFYFKKNKADSANFYYQKALKLAILINTPNNRKESYQKLALVSVQLGDMDKSFEYLKKYSSIADSLAGIAPKASKISSELVLTEKDKKIIDENIRYALIILSVVGLLIVVTYCLLFLRKHHIKTVKQQRLEKQKIYEDLSLLTEDTVSDKINEKNLKEVIDLAVANDPYFMTKFKELQPLFIQKLMEYTPSLGTSELLICAQLRLGFYTKEIAKYTETSVRAVEGKKHRIRKKLNIPPLEDINVWMIRL